MEQLGKSMRERWSVLGPAARLWWAGLATVGVAAVLVLAATTVSDASSHPASTASRQRRPRRQGRHGRAPAADGSMAGMAMGIRSSSTRIGLVVRVVDVERRADDLDRVLQRQGRDDHVQRHGDGARALGIPDRGPAGGGQPAGGRDRRPR